MSRKITFILFIILLCSFILSFNSCGTFTFDKSTPLEDQAQVIISDFLTVTGINGKPVRGNIRRINVPAGSNSFTFDYREYEYFANYYVVYPYSGFMTIFLQPGRFYLIYIYRQDTSLKFGVELKGYTEYYAPSQDEYYVLSQYFDLNSR